MAIKMDAVGSKPASRLDLMSQGFVTAIANPKGWAFFVALLPPFLDASRPLDSQLTVLIAIILTLEFICLLIYAAGGRTLKAILMPERKCANYEPYCWFFDDWCRCLALQLADITIG